MGATSQFLASATRGVQRLFTLASDLNPGVESTLWIANAAVGGLTAPPIFQLTVGRKSHLSDLTRRGVVR
jgi:hypothetical protein